MKLNRTFGRFETLPPLPELNILLTNTLVPRSTRELVGKVKQLHLSVPTVTKPIMESIEAISQQFLKLVDP